MTTAPKKSESKKEVNTADVVQIDNTFASDVWRKQLLQENFMDKSMKLQP